MTSALGYLETVRDASRDVTSARRQLEVRSTSPAQATREKLLRRRIERDEGVIEECSILLYDKLAERLTPRHADVCWLRYAEDRPWKQIAHNLDLSVTTCRSLHDEALRTIDECGLLETS